MHLGANVLLPEGWDTHPEARYPLFIYHGHFPPTFDRLPRGAAGPEPGARLTRARFSLEGYNRIAAGVRAPVLQGVDRARTSRACIVIEIQHANPFYDDSYAVNSANLGPYGDAIV